MKMESEIQNNGFLISPTMHLFPLASQLGSRGVSSIISFELKIWNNEKYHQSIQSYMSILNQNRKKGKMQKSETDVNPSWGDGERARKSLVKKRFHFIIIGYNISKLKYQKPLGPYTG